MISLFLELPGEIDLYIHYDDKNRLKPLLESLNNNQIIDNLEKIDDYSKIIVDKRDVDHDFYTRYLQGRNVIAIDEGGAERAQFPFLIDILPLPDRFSVPNIRSISFLNLPERQPVKKNNRIMVSFGGEDPESLTERFCEKILKEQKDLIPRLTIVLGPLYQGNEPDSSFHMIRNPQNFQKLLSEHSGLICSFGITAFEANHLKVPVLLLNPGEYHEELGKISGFVSAGIKNVSSERISSFVRNPDSVKLVKMDDSEFSLSGFINNLDNLHISCPVCSGSGYTVKARFQWRTYNRCDHCGMIYMLNYNKNKIVYDKEYFFDQYENQYGKTYLDDFEHLTKLADGRLNIIRKSSSSYQTVLDVGCAYGPFLKKSAQFGFTPFGTDISDDAVEYVKTKLNMDAQCSEFHNFTIPAEWMVEKFDVLTMWYVIEHFPDLSIILGKVNSLLRMGGMFSFSTPSGSGISAKNNDIDFFNHSPDDHYTIWEPDNCRAVLDYYGFRIVKKRITGHHPERFNSFLSKSKSGCKILMKISQLFQYGDTFEIYAEKVREL